MRKAGDIVTELFSEKFGPQFMETARTTSALFSSWTRVITEVWPRTIDAEQREAGTPAEAEPDETPAVAVHSRIRELERGVLLVEADHPGWIQILQTKQGELLSAVQRRYPKLDIRAIAFRLSREPFSPSQPAAAPENKTDDNRPRPEPAPINSGVVRNPPPRDEEFYTALKGLEESIKKRNKL